MTVLKRRPKVGDRVEFRHHRRSKKGRVTGVVAETGVHFMIETPRIRRRTGEWSYDGAMYAPELIVLRIPLSSIVKILPSGTAGSPKK